MDCLRNLLPVPGYRGVPQNTSSPEMEMERAADCDDRSNPYNEAPMLAACRTGNLVWLQELLEDDSNQVNQLFLSGKTGSPVSLLYIAAQFGHLDVVKRLIDAFSKAVEPLAEEEKLSAITAFLSTPRKDGVTALFIAARNGNCAVLKFLLERGIDPEQELVKCFLGKYRVFKWLFVESPLKVARESGHLSAQAILERAIQERKTAEMLKEEERLTPGTAVTAL